MPMRRPAVNTRARSRCSSSRARPTSASSPCAARCPRASAAWSGPFVFFDHMGPAEFPPGKGIAVRPHPHIGIATITYLFEGEIMHRDSLGVVQPIQAGAVNLMVAGRGIVHSERAGADLDELSHLHGIQSWIALPVAEQECEPAFTHYSAQELPELNAGGARVRIIMGSAYGERSPVQTFSDTLYLDCALDAGAELALPDGVEETGVLCGRRFCVRQARQRSTPASWPSPVPAAD